MEVKRERLRTGRVKKKFERKILSKERERKSGNFQRPIFSGMKCLSLCV